MDNRKAVSFRNVDITDGFWAQRQQMNKDVTIFAVEDRFRDTGRFEAFRFIWSPESSLPKPHYFWDSDIAKWMESAAYILQKNDVPSLYDAVNEVIDQIEAHQLPDGYFNIYHTVVAPEERLKYRDHHELYCLGHLIEAAVAWVYATGEDRFLNILDRYIDFVIRVFVREKTASFSVPGHEEIELALIKLYRLRPLQKYLDLAMFFLNQRGTADGALGAWADARYDQNHLPVREQKTAEGHAVRACYLYSAMADAAKETGDVGLVNACKAIFDDIVYKKMYITGGIGSSCRGEAFTVAYDLPNDTAYTETCAAIALAMFANRMKDLDFDSKYADTVERVLYNGFLSGISLDGKSFFYENPLEINVADHKRNVSVHDNDRLPITQRLEVFDCSCCPPNVTRLIASVGDYLYSCSDVAIFVHQFMTNDAVLNGASVSMETNYPADGTVKLEVAGAKGKSLYVRIPGWCGHFTATEEYTVENGYARFIIDRDMFTLSLVFEMKACYISSDSRVRADVGKVALTYGPLVYCLEGVDHAFPLFDVYVDMKKEPVSSFSDEYGIPVFQCEGRVCDVSDLTGLYFAANHVRYKKVSLRFIPYFAFANRGESDMRIWLNRD